MTKVNNVMFSQRCTSVGFIHGLG